MIIKTSTYISAALTWIVNVIIMTAIIWYPIQYVLIELLYPIAVDLETSANLQTFCIASMTLIVMAGISLALYGFWRISKVALIEISQTQ